MKLQIKLINKNKLISREIIFKILSKGSIEHGKSYQFIYLFILFFCLVIFFYYYYIIIIIILKHIIIIIIEMTILLFEFLFIF